ncbi:type IV pilus modification PilV family protein [Fusobacterium ulcerans]|uniref:type IV pilus modification PilV family protein n=1 Tax=Fusobacterium ulcerans TaxID=861 RepID=UPI003FEE7F18
MRDKAFSFIEVIISMSLFLITILPLMEFNREMLKTNRKYMEIEQNEKNFHLLERKIISKGYQFLILNLGNHEYIIEKNKDFNSAFSDLEFLYKNKENKKILLSIDKVVFKNKIEEEKFLRLKIELHSKNMILKKEKLISEYDEYY